MRAARRSQAEDRARFRQRMRHGDEVVLATDTAHDPAVGEAIGHRGAQARDHHRRVDEPRVASLRGFQLPAPGPTQIVDPGDAAHREAPSFLRPACRATRHRSRGPRKKPGIGQDTPQRRRSPRQCGRCAFRSPAEPRRAGRASHPRDELARLETSLHRERHRPRAARRIPAARVGPAARQPARRASRPPTLSAIAPVVEQPLQPRVRDIRSA